MKRSAVTATLIAALAGITTLASNPTLATVRTPDAMELSGEAVASIKAANGISGWSHIDNQRVLVNLDEKSAYLLTLKHQCHGLAWAQNVTVTMSNNTIWAGFDAISADGLACPIDRIEKINPQDL